MINIDGIQSSMTSIHLSARELDEVLSSMLSGGESEIFELKEAKNGYGLADIGRYFSALSNEALLRDAPYAWLVFGVRDRDRAVVGTGFRPERASLDSLKHEIAQNVSGHLTFFEIHEVQRNGRRVLMFQIPAARAWWTSPSSPTTTSCSRTSDRSFRGASIGSSSATPRNTPTATRGWPRS